MHGTSKLWNYKMVRQLSYDRINLFIVGEEGWGPSGLTFLSRDIITL